jgi:16S rRNA (guanine527-N7)-methyltransferase
MRPVQIVRAEPYRGSRDHHLHLYEKVRVTPERFPRRPGMARKRPIA